MAPASHTPRLQFPLPPAVVWGPLASAAARKGVYNVFDTAYQPGFYWQHTHSPRVGESVVSLPRGGFTDAGEVWSSALETRSPALVDHTSTSPIVYGSYAYATALLPLCLACSTTECRITAARVAPPICLTSAHARAETAGGGEPTLRSTSLHVAA